LEPKRQPSGIWKNTAKSGDPLNRGCTDKWS
jgi:hypothetical protein